MASGLRRFIIQLNNNRTLISRPSKNFEVFQQWAADKLRTNVNVIKILDNRVNPKTVKDEKDYQKVIQVLENKHYIHISLNNDNVPLQKTVLKAKAKTIKAKQSKVNVQTKQLKKPSTAKKNRIQQKRPVKAQQPRQQPLPHVAQQQQNQAPSQTSITQIPAINQNDFQIPPVYKTDFENFTHFCSLNNNLVTIIDINTYQKNQIRLSQKIVSARVSPGLKGIIILTGGEYSRKQTLIIDGFTNTTTIGPNLPYELKWHSTVRYGNEIWLLGGHDCLTGYTNRTLRINNSIDQWKQGPPLKQNRSNCAVVQHGDELYVAGGIDTYSLNSIERFTNFQWELLSIQLPVAVQGSAIVINQHNMLLLGGKDNTNELKKWVYQVNMVTGRHQQLPSLEKTDGFYYDSFFMDDEGIKFLSISGIVYVYNFKTSNLIKERDFNLLPYK